MIHNIPEVRAGDPIAAEQFEALRDAVQRPISGENMLVTPMGVSIAGQPSKWLLRYLLLENLTECQSAQAYRIRIKPHSEVDAVCEYSIQDTVTLHDTLGVVASSALALGSEGAKYIPAGYWAVGGWFGDSLRHEPLVFGACECDSSSSSSSSSCSSSCSSSSSSGPSSSSSSSSSSSGAESSSSSSGAESSSSSGEVCVDTIEGVSIDDIPVATPTEDDYVLGKQDGCLVWFALTDCDTTSSSGA